mmetsp:Transcript_92235/g.298627  ORF Transcript_92235/g.298627 Transcript_92235/m.298627 type:complete len:219 (-) Transcript_92235:88-744(-)
MCPWRRRTSRTAHTSKAAARQQTLGAPQTLQQRPLRAPSHRGGAGRCRNRPRRKARLCRQRGTGPQSAACPGGLWPSSCRPRPQACAPRAAHLRPASALAGLGRSAAGRPGRQRLHSPRAARWPARTPGGGPGSRPVRSRLPARRVAGCPAPPPPLWPRGSPRASAAGVVASAPGAAGRSGSSSSAASWQAVAERPGAWRGPRAPAAPGRRDGGHAQA